jgi:hypothetical protein
MQPDIEVFYMIYFRPTAGWKEEYGHYALDADGTMFLSGRAFHPDAIPEAYHDEEPGIVLKDERILLLRVEWLKKHFPKSAAEISRIENIIRRSRCGLN